MISVRAQCVSLLFLGFLAVGSPVLAAKASSSTFEKLFTDPNNVDLNRKYAAEAEAQGKLRLALSALERARAARPDDQDIFREFERVRAELLPASTSITWQLGGAYATNPRQARRGPLKSDDGILDGAVVVQDERTILGKRWRTYAYGAGQLNADFSEINAGRVFAESGPLFTLTEGLWVQVAPGSSATWVDGKLLYDEVSAAATFGASFWGMTQTLTARYSWRFGENFKYSDAEVFDVYARLAKTLALVRGDMLFLEPRYRISTPDSTEPTTLVLPTVLGSDTLVARDLSPLEYQEWGARASYFFPVAKGRALVGAGLAIYDRHFSSPVLDQNALALGVTVGTDKDRHDIYFEPTAHLILPNMVAPNVDLRFDYRFEVNTSNDDSREYENHVAGMRIVGRF